MESKLPLGLIKQVALKLDSALGDLYEIRADDEIDQYSKECFDTLIDTTQRMEASILNVIHRECNDEEILNEDIPMDEIDRWPEIESDLLEEEA